LLALLLLLTSGETATAPTPPAPAEVSEAPRWIKRPSGEDIASSFPREAISKGVGGRAVLVCKILATGRMGDCAVVEETQAGLGFGKAALHLARYFQMSLGKGEGSAKVGGEMRLPLVWRLPD